MKKLANGQTIHLASLVLGLFVASAALAQGDPQAECVASCNQSLKTCNARCGATDPDHERDCENGCGQAFSECAASCVGTPPGE